MNTSKQFHIRKAAIRVSYALAFAFAFAVVSLGQGLRSGSTTRGFLLYGDVKVDESQVAGEKPITLDVILYTKGNQVVARQRINPNGRYRFMDIFDGDYWLVIEIEGAEVIRESVFIAKTTMAVDIQHDLNLEWRKIRGAGANGSGVVSAANLYKRSAPNELI